MKYKLFRRIAFFASLLMLLTSTVNTTFGFIVTETDRIDNTFVPQESAKGTLLLNKQVEHPFDPSYVVPDHIRFDFKVELGAFYANATLETSGGTQAADEAGAVLVSLQPGQPFVIEGLDAGTPVTVTELQKGGSGFVVKDDAVTQTGVVAEDGTLTIEYVNVYLPRPVSPANVIVTGEKILDNRPWQEGDTFTYRLEQKVENNAMHSNDTWRKIATETIVYHETDPEFNDFQFTVHIQTLIFEQAGIYHFRLTEEDGHLNSTDYDTTVNHFSIRVTDVDMDGNLEINSVTAAQNASVTKLEDGYHVHVRFYDGKTPVLPDPEDITVDIGVDKIVDNTGETAIGPEGFEFVLEDLTTGEKFAKKTDESGRTAFSLPFTAADVEMVYHYRLWETNDGREGVTYDETIYIVTISIGVDAENQLTATVSVNGETVEVPVVAFQNIYHKGPATPPTGDRGDRDFWFVSMLISGTICIVLALTDERVRAKKAK